MLFRQGLARLGRAGAATVVAAFALAVTTGAGIANTRPQEAGGKAPPHAANAPAGLALLDATSLRQVMRKAKGRELFIHLWASWCGPCMEELPDIDRLARQARAHGATFLSISLDDPRRSAHVVEVLRRQAPDLTRFMARLDDPDGFTALFGGEWDGSIPALFVYDGAGRVRASFSGELENADIRRMLAELSGARPGRPPR